MRVSAYEEAVGCKGVSGWLVDDPGVATVVERRLVPDNMAATSIAAETRDVMKRSLATPMTRVL
jgi:hypothetical protein